MRNSVALFMNQSEAATCLYAELKRLCESFEVSVLNVTSYSSPRNQTFIPPRRTEPKERRYFNSCPEETERHLYDSVYRRAEGYDMKLHRDDRTHAKSRGLDIYSEECSRPAPVLSSSEYGRRLPLPTYEPGRRFARVSHVRSEFYRKNGISKSAEEGYGSVFPV